MSNRDEGRVISILRVIESRGDIPTVAKLRKYTSWDKADCQRLLDTMVKNRILVVGYFRRWKKLSNPKDGNSVLYVK
jgi:hypothetical protein